MVLAMIFCPECGTQNNDQIAFCMNCGKPITAATPIENRTNSIQVTDATKHNFGELFNIVKFASVAVIIFIAGVLATSNGTMGSIVGKRYTESQIVNAKNIAYESGKSDGYESGKTDGYSSGYEVGKTDGYSTGYAAGCNSVFENVGYSEIIGIYYPYYESNIGENYYSQSSVC